MSISITNSRINHLRIAMGAGRAEDAKAIATKEGFFKSMMSRISPDFRGAQNEKHTRICELVDLLYDLRTSFGELGHDTEHVADLVANYKQAGAAP